MSILFAVNQNLHRVAYLRQEIQSRTASLEQKNKDLLEVQERERLTVKAANVGLWSRDLVTNQVYYSPEWKRQIGYEDGEISDNSTEWRSRVHPADIEAALQSEEAFIAHPYPNYHNEFRLRHKDGSYRWILVQAELLYDEQRQTQPEDRGDEEELVAAMQRLFAESRRTYGSPRMTAALRQRGIPCNRKRVARLMRQHHLVARYRQRRRVRTTDSHHGFPIAPNRLDRQFSAARPNEKWVVDFTYVNTAAGWLYLALVLDVFSRKIVG